MVLMLLLPSQAIEINVVIYYHCQTDLCVCAVCSAWQPLMLTAGTAKD